MYMYAVQWSEVIDWTQLTQNRAQWRSCTKAKTLLVL